MHVQLLRVCIWMLTCFCMYIHAYVWSVPLCVCMLAWMHAYMCLHVYLCIYKHAYVSEMFVFVCSCANACVFFEPNLWKTMNLGRILFFFLYDCVCAYMHKSECVTMDLCMCACWGQMANLDVSVHLPYSKWCILLFLSAACIIRAFQGFSCLSLPFLCRSVGGEDAMPQAFTLTTGIQPQAFILVWEMLLPTELRL